MNIALGSVAHRDFTRDAVCFESDAYMTFEYENSSRTLELRVVQTQSEEDTDPLTNQLLPLVIILRDNFRDNVYEDVYYFTQQGNLLRHGWRTVNQESSNQNFSYDEDITKLGRFQHQIGKMLEKYPLRYMLEKNPIIQGLRARSYTHS
ncbi:MAG: hypothetical protein RL557_159 [archaeon]|jgi:hypothetical protein